MPSEEVVTQVRKHPMAIVQSLLWILAGLIGVGILTGLAGHGSGGLVKFAWFLWVVLFVWKGWDIVTWWRTYFVVTANRLMLISGIFNRDVGMMPLTKVTDLRLVQSTAGRMFSYAEFIVESAGQEQALSRVPFVPYPTLIYQEILNLIFPPNKPPSPPSQSDPGY